MLVLHFSALLLLVVNTADTEDLRSQYEMEVWKKAEWPLWEQLSSLQKEFESLKNEQMILKQKQEVIQQMLAVDGNVTSMTEGINPFQLFSPPHVWSSGEEDEDEDFLNDGEEGEEEEEEEEEEEDDHLHPTNAHTEEYEHEDDFSPEDSEEDGDNYQREEYEDNHHLHPTTTTTNDIDNDIDHPLNASKPLYDPCYRYKILDQAWRSTNFSTKKVMCDRTRNWQGWYRLYYKRRSIQMPEKCINSDRCGTHAPLWLTQPHPRIRDGIVFRRVCGSWRNKCCAFKSPPIQVKACRGNYYVYRFVKPSACYLAYCADVNTLVCGRCGRNQYCQSRDKIIYRCANRRRRRKIKKLSVHFFASYPGSLKGKVNRIKFSRVLVNEGRAFNQKTGVFRAPVSGVYQFYFSNQIGGNTPATNLWLVINGYWVTVSHSSVKGRTNSVGSLNTYMTALRKGSQVYVTHVTGQSWANSASNTITFGGSLLVQRKLE